MKLTRRRALSLAAAPLLPAAYQAPAIYVVPNFHPASCGWLTNFSRERVYCANSYFDHLDRVRDDPAYAFVLSECNNLIAMMNFQPGRMEELKRAIRSGRVELVNAFFLESTINLSGGEALVRLGVEGLRWQQAMFGVRPRFAWTIDVCGTHDQMAQITAGLGLEAMVYTRKNPTGSALHWAVSPDGSRTLAISPGHYSELGGLMKTPEPLDEAGVAAVAREIEAKRKITPSGAPILILAGNGDYALAPACRSYPTEFLKQWSATPGRPALRFATLSQFADAVLPGLKSGAITIPAMQGGTAYDFDSFWIQNPKVKTWYRANEHKLQAAEMLAAAASLRAKYAYPAERLYKAWVQMFLNMDRNTLWGAAGGMVFEHPASWDARDRFRRVEREALTTIQAAGSAAATGHSSGLALFNPLPWKRLDPERDVELAPAAVTAVTLAAPPEPRPVPVPEIIETAHFRARIDPGTGALTSLQTRNGRRELLAGPANVLVAERSAAGRGDPGDFTLPREKRTRLASTSDSAAQIAASETPRAVHIEVRGTLFGRPSLRRITFHRNYPRIDFHTEVSDIPDRSVLVAEFPLAGPINEVRRGIPYGFSHGAWDKPNPELHGWTRGIVPAVRWSHYTLDGAGVALLDRGLTGRELTGHTPILFLYNATAKYYGYSNSWLDGAGLHQFEYALTAHEGDWKDARIPHLAWEYNCPPFALPEQAAEAHGQPIVTTSGNVIVECLRRTGSDIEVRLAECLGFGGEAELTLNLPHKSAALTDLTGANARPLDGGPRYRFPVRPQQIVTLRFRAPSAVDEPPPITQWDDLAPENKRAALHQYSADKGHPPRGN